MNNNQIEEFFIWDEKSCTEHQTKSENKTENGMNVTIPETKKESNKKSLKDTIKNEWKRNCPMCMKMLKYKSQRSFNRARKKNQCCRLCGHVGTTGHKFSDEHCKKKSDIAKKLNFGKWMIGKKLSESTIIKIKKANSGRIVSEETRRLLSIKNTGKTCSKDTKLKISKKSIGRICKESTRQKLRYAAIKSIEEGKLCKGDSWKPFYNPKACEYFDKLNLENNWKLQHALNGGEIKISRYWIDAYDKEKNIVVEYDEKHHYKPDGSLNEKDILRQQRIIEYLKCRFFRYNENTRILTEINKDPTLD